MTGYFVPGEIKVADSDGFCGFSKMWQKVVGLHSFSPFSFIW
jgi:hypothetical protein